MRHAAISGTALAIACGLLGSILVVRAQIFAADALAHLAYAGALGAAAAGVDLRVGMFVAAVVGGVALGWFSDRGSPGDVEIGTAFAWVLGLAALFAQIASRRGGGSSSTVNVLFGSIFGMSDSSVRDAVAVSVVVVVLLALVARPLLFASVDPIVATARSVPVRALGALILALVGAETAAATPAVGALLVLGLLAGPAATARRLFVGPVAAAGAAGALAVLAMWAGLTLAYCLPQVPAGAAVCTAALVEYLVATIVVESSGRRRLSRRNPGTGRPNRVGGGSG
jgi:zinc/manganese transport system permease protein